MTAAPSAGMVASAAMREGRESRLLREPPPNLTTTGRLEHGAFTRWVKSLI